MRGTLHLQQQQQDHAGSPVRCKPQKRRRKHTLSLGSIRKYLVRKSRTSLSSPRPGARVSSTEAAAPQPPPQLGTQLTQRLTAVLASQRVVRRRARAPPRRVHPSRYSAASPTSSVTSASTGTSRHLPAVSPVRTSTAAAAASGAVQAPALARCAGFSFTSLDTAAGFPGSSFRPVAPRHRTGTPQRAASSSAYTKSLAADKGSRIHLLTSIAKQQLQNQVRQNAYAGRVALLK